MSFDGIKNNLVTDLNALGYAESKEAFNTDNMSPNEFGNTFILSVLSGESGDNSENINTRLYDEQIWQIQIAYERSEHNDITQRDAMYRSIPDIIKKIDNPDNWENVTNGARTQKYQSWEVAQLDDYYVLTVLLQIVDTINY